MGEKKPATFISISSDNIESSIYFLIGATLNCDLVPNWSSHPPIKAFAATNFYWSKHRKQFLLLFITEGAGKVVVTEKFATLPERS